MAEELSIDVNTVCRWVRDYRRKHDLPTWHEENKRRRPGKISQSDADLFWKNKELERDLKRHRKMIASLEEEKTILKKSLAIFTQPHA